MWTGKKWPPQGSQGKNSFDPRSGRQLKLSNPATCYFHSHLNADDGGDAAHDDDNADDADVVVVAVVVVAVVVVVVNIRLGVGDTVNG